MNHITNCFFIAAVFSFAVPVFANSTSSFCQWAGQRAEESRIAYANEGKSPQSFNFGEDMSKDSYFRGCRFDISWMQIFRRALCGSGTEPHLANIVPKRIYFVFDGAGDFNALRARTYAENIDGSEGMEMDMGNFNGGSLFLPSIKNYEDTKNDNYSILYYSGSGLQPRESFESANACAKDISKYLQQLPSLHQAPQWITMGFSNGAYSAVEFQNFVADSLGHKVTLTFSVDPIPRTTGYLFKDFFKYAGDRHPKTQKLLNFYQTDDYDSYPPLKLRGKPVKNADRNIHLNSESDSYLSKSGRFNHAKIISSSTVKEALRESLQELD